jgi:hypothetical protein
MATWGDDLVLGVIFLALILVIFAHAFVKHGRPPRAVVHRMVTDPVAPLVGLLSMLLQWYWPMARAPVLPAVAWCGARSLLVCGLAVVARAFVDQGRARAPAVLDRWVREARRFPKCVRLLALASVAPAPFAIATTLASPEGFAAYRGAELVVVGASVGATARARRATVTPRAVLGVYGGCACGKQH